MPIGTCTDVSSPRMAATRTAGAIACATLAWLSSLGSALAAPSDPPADAKEEADAHYSRGRELYNRGEWEAALGEFVASRKLRSSWAVTAGVAFCLAKLHRYDEALDTFEAVLRDFGEGLAPRPERTRRPRLTSSAGTSACSRSTAPSRAPRFSVDGRGRGPIR